MTSQPFETIPKEPTPTPAPARVTADPPKTKPAKNPGRVASGKRLAERNRLAREAKKKAEAESAKPAASASDVTTTTAKDSSSSSSLSLGAVLGIGGLIVSAAGLYYQREAIMTRLKPAPPSAGTITSTSTSTSPVSHSGKTRHKENGISLNTIYTMEHFAQGIVAGFAVSMTIPAMYYFQQSSSGNSVCCKQGNRKSPRACYST